MVVISEFKIHSCSLREYSSSRKESGFWETIEYRVAVIQSCQDKAVYQRFERG